jgi:hypothetical protein
MYRILLNALSETLFGLLKLLIPVVNLSMLENIIYFFFRLTHLTFFGFPPNLEHLSFHLHSFISESFDDVRSEETGGVDPYPFILDHGLSGPFVNRQDAAHIFL